MKQQKAEQIVRQTAGSIYDYPNLYDALFSDLCRAEIRFLISVFERCCRKKNGSVFEPACGSGRILCRLAALGFDIAGLDLNPNAAAFCNRRLKRNGFRESAICGDMSDFSLASLGRTKKFDAAFNFVSSFLHLTEESAAQRHLHCVADILKRGGIYLLGIHLKPKGRSFCSEERWSVRRGRLAVQSCLRTISRNVRKRLETVEFCIEAETPSKKYSITDRFPLRTYSAEQFFDLLKAVNRFDVSAVYTFDYDISHPVTVGPDTEDAVFVLQKRD